MKNKNRVTTIALIVAIVLLLVVIVIAWQASSQRKKTAGEVPAITDANKTALIETGNDEKISTEEAEIEYLTTTEGDYEEPAAAAAGLSPTDAYLAMKKVESTVKTPADYLAMVNDYYSSNAQAILLAEWEETPENERTALVQMWLNLVPRLSELVEITENKQEGEEAAAFLEATTASGQIVKVTLSYDNKTPGAWLIEKEAVESQ